MVTFHLAHTLPLNPPGAQPVLTPAQAWAGLARKARRPQDFVPVVSHCDVQDVGPAGPGDPATTTVAATVYFHAGAAVAHPRVLRETCTLRPPCRLDYAIEGGSSAVNLVGAGPRGADAGDLWLTFAFCWVHDGVDEGGEEARRLEEGYRAVSCPFFPCSSSYNVHADVGRLARGRCRGPSMPCVGSQPRVRFDRLESPRETETEEERER